MIDVKEQLNLEGKIVNNGPPYNGNLEDHLATGRDILWYSLGVHGGNQRSVYLWYGPGHSADNPYGPNAQRNRNIYADQLMDLQRAYQPLFDCLTGTVQ